MRYKLSNRLEKEKAFFPRRFLPGAHATYYFL